MSSSPLPDLGHFVRRVWRRAPLLVRGAFPELRGAALGWETLRGLAQRSDVESRLVLESSGEYPWQVAHGPLPVDFDSELPDQGWSLLIHDIERFHPPAQRARSRFTFLPRWCFDDVMVSHAPTNGSVGPHIDRYDAFLIQVSGRRHWQLELNSRDPAPHELVPNADLAVVQQFEPDVDWPMEPGDLLYVPPGLAHWGIGDEPSQTWSVGIRAPGHGELISAFADSVLALSDPLEQVVPQPAERPADRLGEITPEIVASVRTVLRAAFEFDGLGQWLGEFLTMPARELPSANPEHDLARPPAHRLVGDERSLSPVSGVRMAYSKSVEGSGGQRPALLFANGESFSMPGALGESIAACLAAGRALREEDIRRATHQPRLAAALEELIARSYVTSQVTP